MSRSPDEIREFQLHPDREKPRRALESLEVDPVSDVIFLASHGSTQDYRDFPKGKLIDALTNLDLEATSVVVTRDGKEIFREENIKDLFGVVFF